MTREEAIKRLKETRTTIQPYRYVDEALDMAIKELEQEPCIDAIKSEIQFYADNHAEPFEMGAYYHCLKIIDDYTKGEPNEINH